MLGVYFYSDHKLIFFFFFIKKCVIKIYQLWLKIYMRKLFSNKENKSLFILVIFF